MSIMENLETIEKYLNLHNVMPDAGKDWRQEEMGTTKDEMVGWHHWLSEHGFEQTLGDREGQGSLEFCSLWGRKESDLTEQLNNNVNYIPLFQSSLTLLFPSLQANFSRFKYKCSFSYNLALIEVAEKEKW